MKYLNPLVLILIFATIIGCSDDPLPKPKAMLRLEYTQPEYKRVDVPLPFTFDKNIFAEKISKIKLDGVNNTSGVDINYPSMKGTIYLTYKKVTSENLIQLLTDAQNLTQKHTIKADEIEGDLYENPEKNVMGYKV